MLKVMRAQRGEQRRPAGDGGIAEAAHQQHRDADRHAQRDQHQHGGEHRQADLEAGHAARRASCEAFHRDEGGASPSRARGRPPRPHSPTSTGFRGTWSRARGPTARRRRSAICHRQHGRDQRHRRAHRRIQPGDAARGQPRGEDIHDHVAAAHLRPGQVERDGDAERHLHDLGIAQDRPVRRRRGAPRRRSRPPPPAATRRRPARRACASAGQDRRAARVTTARRPRSPGCRRTSRGRCGRAGSSRRSRRRRRAARRCASAPSRRPGCR